MNSSAADKLEEAKGLLEQLRSVRLRARAKKRRDLYGDEFISIL